MNLDDVVYLSLLFFSIGFGYFYRTIEDKNTKKNVGTLTGLIIITIVSGVHVLHPLLTLFVNALIILFIDKRICHLVSFGFSFLYLFFFRTTIYFGIPYPPAHTNLVQMILTLKIVGLAFEVNSSYLEKTAQKNAKDQDVNEIEPNFLDICHYGLNYIGVLTGPYYRYKTFNDFFEYNFSSYTDSLKFTLNRLKFVPMYALLFLWGSYNWPLSYAWSDEFLNERSWIYRYWYIWPNFFIFRMRIYIGLVLSECVCIMAGLGAYPEFTTPKPGQGPTENYEKLKEIAYQKDALQTESFNYEVIRNINPYQADFCTTYREAMKHWNICVQYWLAVNIYKRFPSKIFRTNVTMLVSAIWHGVYLGYYVCIGTVPFVLLLEDIWVKLLLKNNEGKSLKISEWVIWFFRMHFFSYQAIAFHLLDVNKIVHYYNSIYNAGLILWIFLYALGTFLLKIQKAKVQ